MFAEGRVAGRATRPCRGRAISYLCGMMNRPLHRARLVLASLAVLAAVAASLAVPVCDGVCEANAAGDCDADCRCAGGVEVPACTCCLDDASTGAVRPEALPPVAPHPECVAAATTLPGDAEPPAAIGPTGLRATCDQPGDAGPAVLVLRI